MSARRIDPGRDGFRTMSGVPQLKPLEVGVAGQVESLRRLNMTPMEIVRRLALPDDYLPTIAALCARLPMRHGVGLEMTAPREQYVRNRGVRPGAP